MNSEIIISNAWICLVEGSRITPRFGNLTIKDGRITAFRPLSFVDFISNPDNGEMDSFNAAGRAVTLPLVNFHDHIYSRLAKGLPISGPTDNFEHILSNLWWKLDMALDEEMIRASTQMTILEALRNGVTTIFDHHASPAFTSGSLKIIADELETYHLRGVLCFETSDRNGKDKTREALEENRRFIANHTNDNIKGMMGLHASFTCSDATLQAAADVIHQLDAGIHIHLCEDPADTRISLQKFALAPAARLEKFNLLNEKSILSHSIHLKREDYELIARTGSAIACNLDSNLNNAVGIPDFSNIPQSVPLLAGTDGMHDNLARSMKQLFLLHRFQGNGFEVTFPWFQKICFDQLAFVRRYFPDYPSLQVNDRADLVIWDYVPAAPLSEENFWGHYIYGILERPVHSVMQAGCFLMENYRLTLMDEDRINRYIYLQGERLRNAFVKMG